jgi:hypothetical protein
MYPGMNDNTARRAELGTVVGVYNEKPDWYDSDDWPDRGAVALIKWPGDQALRLEPLAGLIKIDL